MRDNSLPVPPPIETPLNWRRGRDLESEARALKISTAKIKAVFEAHDYKLPDITLYLEVGAVCPFATRWEQEIWLLESDIWFEELKLARAKRAGGKKA